jgi:hypothetical protein
MNRRWLVVPALAGWAARSRLKPGQQTPSPSGSWPQCGTLASLKLSVNRPSAQCKTSLHMQQRFASLVHGPDARAAYLVAAFHEPPLVWSPGFSRLGGAQPAKAGTTNSVPIRFMAATHGRSLEVFPFHEPERRPPARRGGSSSRTGRRAGGRRSAEVHGPRCASNVGVRSPPPMNRVVGRVSPCALLPIVNCSARAGRRALVQRQLV